MNDDEQPKNLFKFNAINGGKEPVEQEDKIPHNDYVVIDIEENEFSVNGFLIFTPHHLAIMQDSGAGAVPALVMPIGSIRFAGLKSVIDANSV
jgi:hypothetical protein